MFTLKSSHRKVHDFVCDLNMFCVFRIGVSVKQQFTEEEIYKDRDSQISAIEKTFEDAQKSVSQNITRQLRFFLIIQATLRLKSTFGSCGKVSVQRSHIHNIHESFYVYANNLFSYYIMWIYCFSVTLRKLMKETVIYIHFLAHLISFCALLDLTVIFVPLSVL